MPTLTSDLERREVKPVLSSMTSIARARCTPLVVSIFVLMSAGRGGTREIKELRMWGRFEDQVNDVYVPKSHTLKLAQEQLVRIGERMQHIGELGKQTLRRNIGHD